LSRVTLLSGGVGGARAARGFAAVLPPDELTVIVNVGDDERIHGVHVSADLDTVVYTLAGVEGPHGWGRADDTFTVMEALERLGVDTTFRLGDVDLATCLARTQALDAGETLSSITDRVARIIGIQQRVLPASDDTVRTKVRTAAGDWLGFQEYFVLRGNRDEVAEIDFEGAEHAKPAPGAVEAIEEADLVVIAPSNPPLSIWPILAIREIHDAVLAAPRVMAVSPLFGGKALKGPADRVMASLGLPAGTAGVLTAYRALLSDLIVDQGDADEEVESGEVKIHALDTHIADRDAAARFAAEVLAL
jgi:LPPG:FO 2-phospho-L-lactate transferase